MSGCTGNNNNRGSLFCFTDFNVINVENGYWDVYNNNDEIIRGIAWGQETCPKTGKKHMQGFVQFFGQSRFARFQKLIKSKCHMEVVRGSINENEEYCSKEGIYAKLGKFVKQGQRVDIEQLHDEMKNGKRLCEIADENPKLWLQYHNGLTSLKHHVDKIRLENKFRDIKTTILVGDAGTGKTKYVYDKYEAKEIFKIDSYDDKKFLFNGYMGEKILLIDDFNGGIQYTKLLHILDRYPYKCNVKNGLCYAEWEEVYFTSNNKPGMWYRKTGDNLKRRINVCLEVGQEGNTVPLGKEMWNRDVQTEYDEWSD